jgi:hypothetical protein
MAVGALLLMEMLSRTLLQNHALRTWFSRCWSSSASANKRRGGGVREGFNPWEPRLWQEMEKDPAVKVTMDRLWRQEFGKLGDRRMFGQVA